MRLLGLSAFRRTSAAALIEDGDIVAAAEEERFSRKKHDNRFPEYAIAFCLGERGIELGGIDQVVFCGDMAGQVAPPAAPTHAGDDRLMRRLRRLPGGDDWSGSVIASPRHHSQAASAFYPSPFERAAVLVIDGDGDPCPTSLWMGDGPRLTMLSTLPSPHSLGLLYSAVTAYVGFRAHSGEYKVMGLAPYGQPRYAPMILDHLLDLKADGTFRLDAACFGAGLDEAVGHLERLFAAPRRQHHQPLTQREIDLAASVQTVIEWAVLRLVRALCAQTGLTDLCLGGDVALNCVANGKVLRDASVDRLWIQPAAGDAGGALGAALAVFHDLTHRSRLSVDRTADGMHGAFLGPAFAQERVEADLRACGARFDVLTDDDLIERTVEALAGGDAVGWMQGRMEFGPRALGARSILADPRSPAIRRRLNAAVKFRERFRPFAPSVLGEDVGDWFDLDCESPYMLVVAEVIKGRRGTDCADRPSGSDRWEDVRSDIPAVTHVDGSARVQTVDAARHPRFHALLRAFKARTGCPVLVNTSFNVHGEPIVCTPSDAFRCFMGTDIDVLAVGNCFLVKDAQDPRLARDHRNAFDPD